MSLRKATTASLTALAAVALLAAVTMVVLQAGRGGQPRDEGRYQVHQERYAGNVARAVEYLWSRYNPEVGLIPEAQPPGGWEAAGQSWTMERVFWLADNHLAAMALERYDPNLARDIAQEVANHAVQRHAKVGSSALLMLLANSDRWAGGSDRDDSGSGGLAVTEDRA